MADWIPSIVRARYLVASLGESSSPPWWRSEATTPAARRMLERLYPRTVQAASLEVAVRAAGKLHDDRLGRLGSYHLFRLPTAQEVALREHVTSPEGSILLGELASIASESDRLAALTQIAQGEQGQLPGPVRCGAIRDLRHGQALQRICAVYLAGFQSATPVYPYLTGEAP